MTIKIVRLTGLVSVGIDVVGAAAVWSTFAAVGGGMDTRGREPWNRPDASAEIDGLVRRGEIDGLSLLLDRPGCGEAWTHGHRHTIPVRRRVLGTWRSAAPQTHF